MFLLSVGIKLDGVIFSSISVCTVALHRYILTHKISFLRVTQTQIAINNSRWQFSSVLVLAAKFSDKSPSPSEKDTEDFSVTSFKLENLLRPSSSERRRCFSNFLPSAPEVSNVC